MSDREPNESASTRLRRFGFKILSRPKKGPTIWLRNGTSYTEQDALKRIEQDLRAVGKGG